MKNITLIIDSKIFRNVKWNNLVKIHNDNKEGKEINIDNVSFNVSNVLYYIRSFSRVFVEYYVNNYIKKNKNFYMNAYGSNNITSDYDVSLTGKGSYYICNQIVNNFRISTKKDLTDVADTNIYITPAFIYNKNIPDWLDYIKVNKICYPFPKTDEEIKYEIYYLLKKETYNNKSIKTKYNELIKIGKVLENKYYYSKNKSTSSKKDFWKLIYQSHYSSIEAYIAISTILIVIVELQIKKNIKNLTSIHYLICAYENLIDFSKQIKNKSISDYLLLKLSKYIYRIIYSLNKTKYSKYIDNNTINIVSYVVANRSNNNIFKTKEFINFKNITKKILKLKKEIYNDLISY